MRPKIQLTIPIEKYSKQLDASVKTIEQFTDNFDLQIYHDPSVNVAEARQIITDLSSSRYICFLDYDTEMLHHGWLDAMYEAMLQTDATVIFCNEFWGTMKVPLHDYCWNTHHTVKNIRPIGWGPAACMLVDTHKIPTSVKWDTNIGLRNGWLGGDFEEVDYCKNLAHHGCKIYMTPFASFHHAGRKSDYDRYNGTDRGKTSQIMSTLVNYRWMKFPDRPDFFRKLKYVRAMSNDDDVMAPGGTLRECYHDVIVENGLDYIASFRKLGLV